MNDENKTKAELIKELEETRRRCAELESCGKSYSRLGPGEETPRNLPPLPQPAPGELELADLLDAQAIQALMDDFYELAHIPMSIVDLKGRVLVGVGWQEICTKFHRVHPETCRHCIDSDIRLSAGVPVGEFRLYKCKNNMWDVATPIFVGGEHVGNVFSGQFFLDDELLDYELFRLQARQYGFPEQEYISALEAVPRLNRKSLNRGMAFLIKLAQMFSLLSYSNIRLSESLAERDTLVNSLQVAEGKYRGIFENATVGIFRTTPSGRFLDANAAEARIYGYDSPEELMNTVIDVKTQLYADPESRKTWTSLIEQHDYIGFEMRMRKKNGNTCWVYTSARPVRDEEGKTIYYEGVSEDITDRKRAEEGMKRYRLHLEELVRKRTSELEERNQQLTAEIAQRMKVEETLRKSGNMYRTIFDNTGTAMLIFGEDTTISLVNTEFERMFLYVKDEVEGKKSWTDLVLREDVERLMEYHRLRGTDPAAAPRNYELKVVDRSGHVYNTYMTVAVIPGTNKRVASLLNITPLKKVEYALRESESYHRALFENAGVAIVHVDAQGNYLRVNNNFEVFIGYTREELKSMNALDITHPDYIEETRDLTKKLIRGEIDQFTQEKCYLCKDGSLRWGETRNTPIRDEQGRFLSAVVAVIDRTHRRRAEEALKNYADEIADLYENAPCGYHSLAEDGTIVRMNNTELTWLGYSRDEVVGKMNFTDFLPAEEMEEFAQVFPVSRKTSGVSNMEGKLTRKNRTVFPVLINTSVVCDQYGNYLMSRSSVFDNTERKLAEDALAKREALYRNLFENASIGMFQSTLEGRFLHINKAYATMLGYESPEEVISTITDTATQIHADPRNRTELLTALERQGWFYAEQPYLRKDGSIMIGKLAVRKLVEQDGVTAYLEGIVEDITERKQTEEALIRSERELRVKAQNLAETNTTMKVLLDTMERDQEDLKERFLDNIKAQVLPYLHKLEKTALDSVQRELIKTTETNLDNIASPFVRKLTSSYLHLTGKEIQIAALIREGKTTKEIAELLNAKQRAINFHRENIRKKLGLTNTKKNLAILLRSFF